MMRALSFTCPQTGRAIDTGVNTDNGTLSSVQNMMMCIQCPNWGMQHRFPIRCGYLAQPSYWLSRRFVRPNGPAPTR
jgi:hypothetical protein